MTNQVKDKKTVMTTLQTDNVLCPLCNWPLQMSEHTVDRKAQRCLACFNPSCKDFEQKYEYPKIRITKITEL